jgi:hypothetical protein
MYRIFCRGLISLVATLAIVNLPLPQAFAIDGAALLTSCANNVNDPLYTRDTIATIMGFASTAALETAITNGTVTVWVASGSGEITGSAGANGNAQDLFCGNGNDNSVPILDSNASTQDFFFGGAGNDSVTTHMWYSTFYGGLGNDYVAILDEASHFYGGPGTDTVGSNIGSSFFIQEDPDTTPPSFPSSDTFNVPENTTVVGTIVASESATITLFGGEDLSKFSISKLTDSSTALSFLTAPNFEAPTDVGANNTYIVVLRGVDGSGNAGYETVTVTVTDVVETSSVNSFGLPGNSFSATYRTSVTISANVTVASKVTFYWQGKRIPGCINKVATGSGSSFIATCAWKPSLAGVNTIYAVATPTSAGITGTTTTVIRVNVDKRSNNR